MSHVYCSNERIVLYRQNNASDYITFTHKRCKHPTNLICSIVELHFFNHLNTKPVNPRAIINDKHRDAYKE